MEIFNKAKRFKEAVEENKASTEKLEALYQEMFEIFSKHPTTQKELLPVMAEALAYKISSLIKRRQVSISDAKEVVEDFFAFVEIQRLSENEMNEVIKKVSDTFESILGVYIKIKGLETEAVLRIDS